MFAANSAFVDISDIRWPETRKLAITSSTVRLRVVITPKKVTLLLAIAVKVL